jgi:hypothetical protein
VVKPLPASHLFFLEMTPAELRSLMYGANLRSGSLGELIGMGAAQVRDWTSGRRPVPAKYIPKIEAAIRDVAWDPSPGKGGKKWAGGSKEPSPRPTGAV